MSPFDRHPSGQLADLAEGALPRAEAARVSRHVLACGECRAELESWRALYNGLARLPRPAVPVDLRWRILQAVAREAAAPAPVPSFAERRRWLAAFSWAYGMGTAIAACFALALAFVPSVRESVGSALAVLSTAGLRAGLSFVDVASFLLRWTSSSLHLVQEWFGWLSPLGRALETLGGLTEVRVAGLVVMLASALLLSGMVVRFLHQRNPGEEAPHVGPLLA